MIEILVSSVQNEWGQLVALFPRIVVAALVLLTAGLAGSGVRRALAAILARAKLGSTHTAFFSTIAQWAVILIGMSIAALVLRLEALATGIIASGGIAAIVLGFAFREIGENSLAGLFLAFGRPFRIGDLIESGGLAGEARDVTLRYTHIRSEDGRDIYIPNAQIFGQPLTNYTIDGLRRLNFTVGIEYSRDSDEARCLLSETVRGVAGVLDEPLAQAHVSALLPEYQELEIRFWIDTLRAEAVSGPEVRSRVMNACRQALLDNGFVLSSDVSSNIDVSGTLSTGTGGESNE